MHIIRVLDDVQGYLDLARGSTAWTVPGRHSQSWHCSAQEIKFTVRHDHLRKGCIGAMTVDDKGIYFHGAKEHGWAWKYTDIQELKLAPGHIHLLT